MKKTPFDLSSLTNVIININDESVKTLEALFTKMTEDRVAGKMLLRLLYWFPKSVRLDGQVYKSWRDWNAEVALSPAQVKRVHHNGILEKFGIERKLLKANGAPTNHYSLNFDMLLKAIAEFFQLALEEVRAMLGTAPSTTKEKKEKQVEPTLCSRVEFINYELTPSLSDQLEPYTTGEVIDNSWLINTKPEKEDVPDLSPTIGTMTARQCWEQAKVQLDFRFGDEAKKRYLKDLKYLDYCTEKKTFTLSVPNAYIQDMLQNSLYRNIQRLFRTALGVHCEFVFEIVLDKRT